MLRRCMTGACSIARPCLLPSRDTCCQNKSLCRISLVKILWRKRTITCAYWAFDAFASAEQRSLTKFFQLSIDDDSRESIHRAMAPFLRLATREPRAPLCCAYRCHMLRDISSNIMDLTSSCFEMYSSNDFWFCEFRHSESTY